MGITLAHNFINLLKRTEEGRAEWQREGGMGKMLLAYYFGNNFVGSSLGTAPEPARARNQSK